MEQAVIRLATATDIDAIEGLYNDLADFHAANTDYTGWKKHIYPNRSTAEEALAKGALYVADRAGCIEATVILNSYQPDAYAAADWQIPAEPWEILVIHTLAVHPLYHSKGLGKSFLAFAEQLAQERNMKAIRLDTAMTNKPAAALYEKIGYRFAGLVDLNLAYNPTQFRCYEKAIG